MSVKGFGRGTDSLGICAVIETDGGADGGIEELGEGEGEISYVNGGEKGGRGLGFNGLERGSLPSGWLLFFSCEVLGFILHAGWAAFDCLFLCFIAFRNSSRDMGFFPLR
jgi:hypothetical protein